MFSLGWSGGVTAASQVAPLAAEYRLPLTLYGRAGPVLLAAATHVAVSAPNAVIQETVQQYVTDWYAEVAAELPDIANGTIAPPAGPGHGVRLRTDLLRDTATLVRAST
jgi:L-alanine-DL-glutamate epimerase-like enolase superfamily enzyme